MKNPLIVESVLVGRKMEVGILVGKAFGRCLAYRVGKQPWAAVDMTLPGERDLFRADDEETKGHLILIGKHGLDNEAATDQEALTKASEVLEQLIEAFHEYMLSEIEELAIVAGNASCSTPELEPTTVPAKTS